MWVYWNFDTEKDDNGIDGAEFVPGLRDDDYRSYDLNKEEFNPDDFESDYYE